jgi:prepilin-type N-terminal cleavage/methylation domain-containing protein
VSFKHLIPSRLAGDSARVGSGRRQEGVATKSRQDTWPQKCNAGFSLLELVVVIIIVALLATIVLGKLMTLMADAERVAVETVTGTLRSALGMKVAESIVKSNVRGLAALEGSNPMEQLAEPPTNYLGALSAPDVSRLEDGYWYFDTSQRQLVYVVRNKAQFSGGMRNPPRARWMVRLSYADRNGNGRYDDGIDKIDGVRLVPVEPYVWMRRNS